MGIKSVGHRRVPQPLLSLILPPELTGWEGGCVQGFEFLQPCQAPLPLFFLSSCSIYPHLPNGNQVNHESSLPSLSAHSFDGSLHRVGLGDQFGHFVKGKGSVYHCRTDRGGGSWAQSVGWAFVSSILCPLLLTLSKHGSHFLLSCFQIPWGTKSHILKNVLACKPLLFAPNPTYVHF